MTNQGVALPEPFDGQSHSYLQWRNSRLQRQQHHTPTPALLSTMLDHTDDLQALARLCTEVRDFGFAVYQWRNNSENASRDVTHLHTALSLRAFDRGVVHTDDGLSLLTDMSGTSQGKFIPYTSKAMGWHTDGYYNTMEQSLRCFTIHCINPAQTGGTLTLLDHQLVLIALFDKNPQLVELLAHPQAMMLPANRDDLGHDRPARYSPVLFVRDDGTPGAHFTTRTRHIEWRSPETLEAAQVMKTLIDDNIAWHHPLTLQAGQGVITRNVLHRREAYTDHPDAPRRMLRGRYLHSPVTPRNNASFSTTRS